MSSSSLRHPTSTLRHTTTSPLSTLRHTTPPPAPPSRPALRRRPLRSPIWRSPLRHGKLNAYDEALKYIRADARTLRAEIAHLTPVAQTAAPTPAAHAARDTLAVLRVQSEINLPEVRYAFRTGRYPFARPVYRHLAEQQWRTDGPLDLLMERLHQMHVVPDLLPALHPDIDLRLQFPRPRRTARDRAREHAVYAAPEPGVFLPVSQTLAPPRIAATVFHDDVRLYTLLMLDPDVPDAHGGTYTTFLHWMQPNIPLSAARRLSRVALVPSPSVLPAGAPPDAASPSDTPPPTSAHVRAHPAFLPLPHVPYIPPHPARGTPYHRYVVLLLPQAHARTQDQRAHDPHGAYAHDARRDFDLRAFLREHTSLGAGAGGGGGGGGAHMWRAQWTPEDAGAVSRVWAGLDIPEPRYGRAPRPDPYGAMNARTRYVV